MDATQTSLLEPTLHVEVQLTGRRSPQVCATVKQWLLDSFTTVTIGQDVQGLGSIKPVKVIKAIEIADYTGPPVPSGLYTLADLGVDVQAYTLHGESDTGLTRAQTLHQEDEQSQMKLFALPNVTLHGDWTSLVFDDRLPSRLLRYLARMIGMMSEPSLNISTFNWNRLCLLHGPPGSGKSTLCRALAQKLSIRLSDRFPKAILVEINTNAMLSKYFGESGKLINSTFTRILEIAEERDRLVVVMMDEVETIAGSREKASKGTECGDGLRATNQLLTALDKLRHTPNVILCCTSNLITAIDPAFLDRVDIKQYVPPPSAKAIYNIFSSCLNELVRSNIVEAPAPEETAIPQSPSSHPSPPRSSQAKPTKKRKRTQQSRSSPLPLMIPTPPSIPTLSETMILHINTPSAPGTRIWTLAQRCQGLSGRTLRRLPILGLAMYTWGGEMGLDRAISALEKAVDEDLRVVIGSAGRVGGDD